MKLAKVTKGNVFEELGFNAAESADLALRAYLMSEIRKFVKANGLTQMRAARFFGVPQGYKSILPAQQDQPSEALGLWFDRASCFFPPGDSGGSYTNGMREFGLAHAKPPPQTGN
jgi:predicted XRE-type DNA-binding protein